MTETYEHEERFWSKVDASGDCWMWTAASAGKGYGKYTKIVDGKQTYPYAHRYAYEILVGPVSGDMVIDHLCRNRKCVNPDHLQPVTTQVNNLRGAGLAAVNAIKTHCLRGHELSGDNVYIQVKRGKGTRSCLTCRKSWKERNGG